MKSIDCDSVLEQLSDYIDADAREELCQAIQDHLKHCPDCRVYVDEVKKTIVLYQMGKNGSRTEVPLRATAALDRALKMEYAAKPPAD